MIFKIKSLDSKNLALLDNQNQIGTLSYESSFTKDSGTIRLNNSINSYFKNNSFLSSKIVIERDKKIVFSIEQNWSGNLKIQSVLTNKLYWLKSLNFWKGTKILLDENGNEILTVSKKYNWKTWNYDYSFDTISNFEIIEDKELLLFSMMQADIKMQMNAAFIAVFVIIIASANH